MGRLLVLVGFLGLVLGYLAAGRAIASPRRPGWATYGIIGAVAVVSLVQVTAAPELLDALGRQSALVVDQHQWWRLLTAVFVQDGGWSGTLVNLVLLVVTVPVAERVWGSTPTVVAFVVCGVLLNVSAVHFGVDGAGNSGATLALGSSLLIGAVVRRRFVPVVVALVGAVLLVVLDDQHWTAVALGLPVGAVLTALRWRRARQTAPQSV